MNRRLTTSTVISSRETVSGPKGSGAYSNGRRDRSAGLPSPKGTGLAPFRSGPNSVRSTPGSSGGCFIPEAWFGPNLVSPKF